MARPPEETRALVLRARAGSRDAFGELMKAHAGLVTAVIAAHTSDRTDVEDLVQEAFMTAWRELSRLRKPESFATWISTIARNLARASLADRARRDRAQRSAPRPIGSGSERDKLYRRVIGEVERLPESYREVFLLRYVGEHDCADIARCLGVALGTVTSRLSRGHQILRERLGKVPPQ